MDLETLAFTRWEDTKFYDPENRFVKAIVNAMNRKGKRKRLEQVIKAYKLSSNCEY